MDKQLSKQQFCKSDVIILCSCVKNLESYTYLSQTNFTTGWQANKIQILKFITDQTQTHQSIQPFAGFNKVTALLLLYQYILAGIFKPGAHFCGPHVPGFLKLLVGMCVSLSLYVCMSVCLCVCMSTPKDINKQWYDMV